MSESKSKGLRLNVGGAPDVAHTIPGVPGTFRPNIPTPVGGPGEIDEALARRLHDDKAVPLELVDIPKAKVDEARETASQDLLEARQGLLDSRKARQLAGREQDRAAEQAASINAVTDGGATNA
jgi:hypothetical protein